MIAIVSLAERFMRQRRPQVYFSAPGAPRGAFVLGEKGKTPS
jgi:hypothetical protein